MAQRVVDQIGDRLFHQRRVAAHPHAGFKTRGQDAALLLGGGTERLDDIFGGFGQIELRERGLAGAAFDFANPRQRLERPQHVLDARHRPRHRIVPPALQFAQHLRQRPAQFVGDVGPHMLPRQQPCLDAVEQAIEGSRQRGEIVVDR